VFYSLSFAPNPNFSKVFPPQAEILEYFNRVAEKFDVTRHIVPNTEWEGAYWQDSSSTWLVKLKNLTTGEVNYQKCKILISAVGGLVNPNQFNVPGVEYFLGDIVHTARWKPEVSLAQKDVIVIGNGCKFWTTLSMNEGC
jgi:cation diffusion facilitator CzcD-associated flavoprotein CzcO